MRQLCVTAVGRDHPGIVAAITKVLYERGCNLDDCSMSLLSGQFAMIMVLEAPDELGSADLDHDLESAAREAGVTATVSEVEPGPQESAARPYVVSVYGGDHPGIVYKVAGELASHRVNITNLQSRLMGERMYAVVLDIDVPDGLDFAFLAERLQRVADREGVELNLRPAEVETL